LLAQGVFGFAWSLYLLVPKFLTEALHAKPEQLGRISAMGGMAGLLTAPFAARGLDRIGRKPFFRLGSALIVVLSLGYLQVRALGPLVYVLQGCISAAFVLAFNATAALLTDYAPPERLGQAIGWLGGCNVLMNAVATMLAEPLAAARGWGAVFVLGSVLGVLSFAMSFALPTVSRSSQPGAATTAVAGPIPLRTVAPILLAALLMGSAFVAIFGFVQPYALSRGAHAVRGFYLGYTLSAVLGRLALGGLGDRVGRRLVSAWMLLGYALCSLTVRNLEPKHLLLYGLMFGAAHGILYPTLNALLLETLPRARRGLGMVLYNGAFNLGSSMGALAWGDMAQHRGYGSVYVTTAVMSLAAALVLVLGRSWRQAARP
jgi:predicted MFS family arabinose efflux permease